MPKKKKNALAGLKTALESALIKTRGCTVNLCVDLEEKKLTAVIEDRKNGLIYDAAADLEVR